MVKYSTPLQTGTGLTIQLYKFELYTIKNKQTNLLYLAQLQVSFLRNSLLMLEVSMPEMPDDALPKSK